MRGWSTLLRFVPTQMDEKRTPQPSSSGAAFSAERTRKAPRTGPSFDTSASDEATLRTITTLGSHKLSKLPLDMLRSVRSAINLAIATAELAIKQEREVEVLLPMDLLMHVFSFLSADALHASRVCWYFESAARTSVRLRICSLVGDDDIPTRKTVDKLRVLEREVPRTESLIASLDVSMVDQDRHTPASAAKKICEDLNERDGTALSACSEAISKKLEVMIGSPNSYALVQLRNELWQLIVKAWVLRENFGTRLSASGKRVPEGPWKVLSRELRVERPAFTAILFTYIHAPICIIEQNAESLMQHLHLPSALDAFQKVRVEKLIEINAEPKLAALADVYHSQTVHEGDLRQVNRLLDKIRAHASPLERVSEA